MLGNSDEKRVAALHHLAIIDTPREDTFDIITAMVADMLDVPHACVSLVAQERVWFKSAFGVDAAEVKREPGFCSTLVQTQEPVRHIEDATSHPETHRNSLVCGQPWIRFYAGAPLSTAEGHRIGTLCAFGPNPRGLSETERSSLCNLATLVMHEIELRRTQRELERTEAALRASQRLESIGLIASGVAHDFNNLLSGILGNAELLRSEVADRSSAQALLGEIETTGRRAADLVGQVLAYAGRDEDSPAVAIDLNGLISETCGMLKGSLETRARIDLELAPDLPAVSGQSTGLRQLVMNLLTNAAEACGETDGVVRIATAVGQDGQNLLLTVTDNGHGVTEEACTRIFEPFYSSKAGGRGLGLAICDRIVDQHGGTIEIESAVADGTTFRVTLPASTDSPALGDAERPEAFDHAGQGLILVVDDESCIRNLASRCLERAGYAVLLAESGAQALEILGHRGNDVQVVILDWSMPVVNGEMVLEAMQERRLSVPVILSSGHVEQDARSLTGAFAVELFLKKPYKLDDLIRKVEQALASGSRALPGGSCESALSRNEAPLQQAR